MPDCDLAGPPIWKQSGICQSGSLPGRTRLQKQPDHQAGPAARFGPILLTARSCPTVVSARSCPFVVSARSMNHSIDQNNFSLKHDLISTFPIVPERCKCPIVTVRCKCPIVPDCCKYPIARWDGGPDCSRSCFAKWPPDCDLIIRLPDCARLLVPDRCPIVFL